MNKKNLMRGVAVLAVTTLLGTATILVTPLNDAYAPSAVEVLLWLSQVTTYM